MIINEQIRRYNEKMDEIEQLEYAEALAVNQLKLKRQNTVRNKVLPRSGSLFGYLMPLHTMATTSNLWSLLSLMPGFKNFTTFTLNNILLYYTQIKALQ